ncbi:MAG: DUF308 domain-containing protein [Coriobacteriales bacterium]|nr:DUF308 domain-containing protein [Coriobacteriales bacterium]
MRVLNFILGLLAIFAGVVCLSNPAEGFILVIWLSAIFLLLFGATLIFTYFRSKKMQSQGIIATGAGIVTLILGIASVVLSILALVNDNAGYSFAIVVLIMFSVWLFITAISTIVMGNSLRKEGATGTGIFLMVFGILLIILALCACTSPLTGVFAIGTIMAIELIFTGMNFIMTAFLREE